MITKCFLDDDEACIRKQRAEELSMSFHRPGDLSFAQALFGQGIGVGVRFVIRSKLPRGRDSVVGHCEIMEQDTLNVVPFENKKDCREIVQRGLDLDYMPALSQLKVHIRFRWCHGRREWAHHLRAWNIGKGVEQEQEEDVWPLHHDISVGAYHVMCINLEMKQVYLIHAND